MSPLLSPVLLSITEFARGADFPVIGVSKDGIISSVNTELEDLLGITAKNLIGEPIYNFITPASVKSLKKVLAQTTGITTFNSAVDFMTSGEIITANFLLFPLYINISSPSYFVLSFNNPIKDARVKEEIDAANRIADLNLRKLHNTNVKLIEARKAEQEAMKVKENFLTNVSHEIRTPLNGIIGITKLLSNSRLDGKQKEFLEAISKSSEQLLNIINDLLDLSKINSSNFKFDNDEFDLHKSLQAIIPVFKIIAEHKKLDFDIRIDKDIPDALIGDQYRLNQVINNLLTNAFKFTSKGTVTFEALLVGIENNIAIIQFKIIDTGIGIAKQNIDKIFDTFTQASNTTNNKYGGTGLGLSISKQLIELLGGAVTVSSKINTGTTFTVTLTMPLAEHSLPKKNFIQQDIDGLSKPIKILAVDDNEINRFYVENVFNDKNIYVKTVEDGRSCLNLLKKEIFDVVLMDLQMPVMDGYKTTLKIRNNLKLTIPIIALTASSVIQEESKCLAAGMNGLIQKPFTKESILFAITNYTDLYKSQKEISSVQTEKPSIDFSKIRSITGNNEERFTELIDLSLKNIDRETKKLNIAVADKNFTDIKAIAHKLKSTFGLYELTNIFKTLDNIEELSGKNSSIKKIEKDLEQLKQPIINVVAELNKYKLDN